MAFKIAALYQFLSIENPLELKQYLERELSARGILGGLIIAKEGINGTISGRELDLKDAVQIISQTFPSLEIKFSDAKSEPFPRLRIRVKSELVTMGYPNVNPIKNRSGSYVDPLEWNKLIEDPEVIVIDTRNEYEISVGSFKNAVNPMTESFKEFPAYIESFDCPKDKKIAMYCTGTCLH